jgi:hypothetical protein
MQARQHPEAAYLALKTAVRQALGEAGGATAVAAAKITRGEHSVLSAYADANQVQHVPLDVALDLDARIDRPVILEAFARAQRYAIAPLADGAVGTEYAPTLSGHILQITKELGDVAGEVTDSAPDLAKVGAAALATLICETSDLIDVVNRMHMALCREQLRRQHGGTNGSSKA